MNFNEISRPNFYKLQASLESKHCKINAKYGKKKKELQAIKTLTQIRKFESSILQSRQGLRWFERDKDRDRDREWLCDLVCVSVYEVGVREKGKGIRVFLVI